METILRVENLKKTFRLSSKQQKINKTKASLKHLTTGFPGGSVVKNPPASARDVGSIPGLGKSHMP